MTSISTVVAGSAYRLPPPPDAARAGLTADATDRVPGRDDRFAPPPPPTVDRTGLSDEKLAELNRTLDSDAARPSGLTSTADLVQMLQNRGIDLGRLRAVLNSGDMLDVRA